MRSSYFLPMLSKEYFSNKYCLGIFFIEPVKPELISFNKLFLSPGLHSFPNLPFSRISDGP